MQITKIKEASSGVSVEYDLSPDDHYKARTARDVPDSYVHAQEQVTGGFAKMLKFPSGWNAVLNTLKLGWAKDDPKNAKVNAVIEVRQASGPPILVTTPARYLTKGAQVDGGGEVLVVTDTLREAITGFLKEAENHVLNDAKLGQLFLGLDAPKQKSKKTA